MESRHYSYRVTWSAEDGEYVGLCAEFPSLSWLNETPEEALGGVVRLVEEVVSDMAANGEPIPQPLADKSYSGKFLIRVTPDRHRMLAIEAAEQGVSLNRFVVDKLCA